MLSFYHLVLPVLKILFDSNKLLLSQSPYHKILMILLKRVWDPPRYSNDKKFLVLSFYHLILPVLKILLDSNKLLLSQSPYHKILYKGLGPRMLLWRPKSCQYLLHINCYITCTKFQLFLVSNFRILVHSIIHQIWKQCMWRHRFDEFLLILINFNWFPCFVSTFFALILASSKLCNSGTR